MFVNLNLLLLLLWLLLLQFLLLGLLWLTCILLLPYFSNGSSLPPTSQIRVSAMLLLEEYGMASTDVA